MGFQWPMGCSLNTPKPRCEPLSPVDDDVSGPTAVFWESKIGLQLAKTINEDPSVHFRKVHVQVTDRETDEPSPRGLTFYFPPCRPEFEDSHCMELEDSRHDEFLQETGESRDELQVLSTQVAFIGDAKHTGLQLSLTMEDSCDSPLSVVARFLPDSSSPDTNGSARFRRISSGQKPQTQAHLSPHECFDSPLSRAHLRIIISGDSETNNLIDRPRLPMSPILQKSNVLNPLAPLENDSSQD